MTADVRPEGLIGLAALLREHRRKSGDSYADMAEKTGLNRSYFGYLINTPPPIWVRGETVEQIASGLHLPYKAVQAAALVTGGYYSLDDADEHLPSRGAWVAELVSDLPDDDLETLDAFVRSLRARRGLD